MIDIYKEYKRDKENFIHPTAIIHPSVEIGKGNYIGPFCVIESHVSIGDNNYFHSHVSVGSPAEHKDPFYDPRKVEQKGKVWIGNGNTFREFVTINKPTKSITGIANNCYIMRGSHISHDTILDDDVIMSCNVILGGHSRVMQGAYMGIASCTHPHTIVGHYSMIGMNSTVVKHVPPCQKIVGSPAKIIGFNTVGVHRNNVTPLMVEVYKNKFNEMVNACSRKEIL